ncbi:MAG TPA: bacillithiol biosynthesis cysteine-adding enzyme BshC, partial [Bacteroidia bacterium]|nr:bacillithiol biosynthesis cysteine-adding enzyme BshC [Bacteroidia bacterium]
MTFRKTNISYKDSGQFSKVLMDYVNGDTRLKPFYEYAPSVNGFGEAIKEMSGHEYPRKILVDSLIEYYNRNAPGMASDATLENIKRLEDATCFTVTTGHQLCLFTGPIYFIFKIITVINLAEKLNKEYPSNHFVPVYWMASEDHDFAEVNHAFVFGKKVEWSHENIGGPVGKLPLSYFSPILENLFAIMGEGENTADLKKIIADSYSSEKTLAEATFCFVNALFGRFGLVVVEPDNANYKQVYSPIITDELLNGNSFKIVTETNKKLAGIGEEPQVHVREINLFYVDGNGRNRIDVAVGADPRVSPYKITNTNMVFTQNEIIDLAKTSPEKFSPNVILRPLYQQMILPNVAYVGGPSEMAYWLQLKGIFENYKVPFPVLMPRNNAMIIIKPVVQKLAKLNLEITDLFQDIDTLIKEFFTRHSDGLPNFEREKALLLEAYSSMGNKVKEVDSTLVAVTEAELQKQLNALKTLETKLTRVLKQKEETSVAQIRKLKEYLFP